MAEKLLQLHVSEINGGNSAVTRTVIVNQTITFFNLHRALQYCIKPRQSDSTVDGKAYTFVHKATNNPIKAPKSAQLNKNSSITSGSAKVGHKYTYTADDKTFLIEITDICGGDGRYYVPRCVAGKNGSQTADLDVTNGKLLVRKFTKAGAGQKKSTAPAFDSTSEAKLNAMKQPLRFWEADSGSREAELVKRGVLPRDHLVEVAMKYAGPEAVAKVPGSDELDRLYMQRLIATSGVATDLIAAAAVNNPAGSRPNTSPAAAAAAAQTAQPDAADSTAAVAAAAVVPASAQQSNPAEAEAAAEGRAGSDGAQQQDVAGPTAAETRAAEATDVPPATDQLAKSTAAAVGSEKFVKTASSTAAGAAQRTLLNWLKK